MKISNFSEFIIFWKLWTIYLFSFFRFPITQTILICCHCPIKKSYFSSLSVCRWNQRGDLRCLCYISRVLLVLVYSRLFDGHHTVCSSPILYSSVWGEVMLSALEQVPTHLIAILSDFFLGIHIAKRDETELKT